MANIVITSTATHVELVFNTKAENWSKINIKRADISEVRQQTNCDSIIVFVFGGRDFSIKHQSVDEVDGDADISSQAILYTKLKGLQV